MNGKQTCLLIYLHILNEQRPIYSLYSIYCFVFDIDTHLFFILSALTPSKYFNYYLGFYVQHFVFCWWLCQMNKFDIDINILK